MHKTPMHWQRGVTLGSLLLAWGLLAVWQWQEYQSERESARQSMRRQAESVMNALVGGIQSHRRLGFFMEEQLQGALDELTKSQDILAAAVLLADGRVSLTAGKADLLRLSPPIQPGSDWEEAGFRCVAAFQLSPEPPPGAMMGRGPGGGMGMGFGRGPMELGHGPEMERPERGPLPAGGRCFAVLLLDRAAVDRQIAHYAWLRILVVCGGGAVILSIALAWRATVRLADARGQAQLLEIEARHLRELSRAAAGLAHETRNPLGLIRGWTQRWAQSIADNPQQRQQAQAVIEECDRVTARINQFLAFARPCQPKPSEVRPAEIVAELSALLEPDLNAKRLRWIASPSLERLTVRADREMFRQALFNLVQNAIEFSPEGAEVEIGLNAGRIEVLARGPGVPAEAVDLLFTPYHTTRSGGTGLGLAIVRRIAAMHGWQSGYAPRPGGGAIFWLEIGKG